jgi:hypothetical protein
MIGPPSQQEVDAPVKIVKLVSVTRRRVTHMRTTVSEILSPDGMRKVEIFRRADGTFGFESLKFSDDPNEMCWIPFGRFSECVTPDVHTAEAEARGRVDWLRDMG